MSIPSNRISQICVTLQAVGDMKAEVNKRAQDGWNNWRKGSVRQETVAT